jgi:hypothetical protein
MLCVSVDTHAANGWFNGDIDRLTDNAGNVLKDRVDQVNNHLEDRIDQVKDHAQELKDQAFDRVELLQVIARVDAEQLIDNAIVDLTQNITKAVITSSLGIGAVIALYQATKAAITIACMEDKELNKKEYITMFSCAGAAALCATCSLFCYWSIN